MPAADDQRHMRGNFALSEKRRQQVALRDGLPRKNGFPAPSAKSPCCGGADKERGGETRTCRGSVGVYPIDGKCSFAEGVAQQARKKREVVS